MSAHKVHVEMAVGLLTAAMEMQGRHGKVRFIVHGVGCWCLLSEKTQANDYLGGWNRDYLGATGKFMMPFRYFLAKCSWESVRCVFGVTRASGLFTLLNYHHNATAVEENVDRKNTKRSLLKSQILPLCSRGWHCFF